MPILLEPLVASFCQAYPEIEVELAASEELVDLAAGGFDAGIRMGQFITPDMVAVRLTKPLPFVIVGSPTYLAGRGRPQRPDDLRAARVLEIATIERCARIMVAQRQRPFDRDRRFGTFHRLRLSDDGRSRGRGRRTCASARPLAADAMRTGKLVRVLEQFVPMTPGVFLYYPGHRQIMPKLRAFIDHVKGRSAAG